MKRSIIFVLLGLLLWPSAAFAAGGGEVHSFILLNILLVGVIFFAAKTGALVERWGIPSVVGELGVGVLIGLLAHVPGGIGELVAETRDHNVILAFLAEFGVVLLLFKSGLEENLQKMKTVGLPALRVAVVGVILPTVIGAIGSYFFFPEASKGWLSHFFVGATFAATSVGLTAAVFQALKFKSKETSVVLGAAVFDDVLAILLLGVLGAIAEQGSVTTVQVLIILGKAVGFLGAAVLLGGLIAKPASRLFSRIHTGVGMKAALALLFCCGFAYLAAELAGLAAIVGAFAAGLVLDQVHFERFEQHEHVSILKRLSNAVRGQDTELANEAMEAAHHADHAHIEELIEGPARFLVPIFFVMTGMKVDLLVFFDIKILGISIVLSVLAYYTKQAAGLVAGDGVNKTLVGVGMIPRGEVGLIFAAAGLNTFHLIDDTMFSVCIAVVMSTTFVAPLRLAKIIRNIQEE